MVRHMRGFLFMLQYMRTIARRRSLAAGKSKRPIIVRRPTLQVTKSVIWTDIHRGDTSSLYGAPDPEGSVMQSRGLPYHLPHPLLDPAPRRFGNSSAVGAAHFSGEIDGFPCPEPASARQL